MFERTTYHKNIFAGCRAEVPQLDYTNLSKNMSVFEKVGEEPSLFNALLGRQTKKLAPKPGGKKDETFEEFSTFSVVVVVVVAAVTYVVVVDAAATDVVVVAAATDVVAAVVVFVFVVFAAAAVVV